MAKDKNITVKISKSRKLQKKLNDLTVKYEETKSDLNNANSCLSVFAKEKEELQNEIRQLEWENGEIRKDFDSCKSVLLANEMERQEMKKQISELETELRVKEDLFTIKDAISERKINLNDTIKVKLTPLGADIFYHQYDKLNKNYGKTVIEPHLPKVDENGYTKFQLYQFMELYGEHIGVTKPNVIEPLDIILCE